MSYNHLKVKLLRLCCFFAAVPCPAHSPLSTYPKTLSEPKRSSTTSTRWRLRSATTLRCFLVLPRTDQLAAWRGPLPFWLIRWRKKVNGTRIGRSIDLMSNNRLSVVSFNDNDKIRKTIPYWISFKAKVYLNLILYTSLFYLSDYTVGHSMRLQAVDFSYSSPECSTTWVHCLESISFCRLRTSGSPKWPGHTASQME